MATENSYSSKRNALPNQSKNIWSGVLFGIGLVAFIDETIFHQILHWHHFYDKLTTAIGLVSDGVFHAFSWFATVASLFMVADLRRRNGFSLMKWLGGVLLGGGAFQLYDGLIQHKLMKIHQIRYQVVIFPYDLVWNSLAAVMLIIGVIIIVRTRSTPKPVEGATSNEP